MDRSEFLLGTVVAGVGTAALAVSTQVSANTCEANLYNPSKATVRLTYPEKTGETSPPIHLEWPPGHVRRYIF